MPIATTNVILAHRVAQARARDPCGRKSAKWQLTRGLYERGYAKENILKLYRLIDWLIQLPEELAVEFQQELVEYEDQKHMPYITSIERLGREEGRRQGWEEGRRAGRQEVHIAAGQKAILDVLDIRFGPVPDPVRQAIETIHGEARLRSLLQTAIQTVSIEDFTREL